MRKPPLTRRELIAVLEQNGFVATGRTGTSHVKYEGVVDGTRRTVTVDQSIDEFRAASHSVLYYIVSTQLGFFGSGSATDAWRRFYGGEPRLARRAQVPYRKW